MAEVKADTAQYSLEVAGQVFQVLTCRIKEGISELFGMDLSLWSENPEVDIASFLRQGAQLKVKWGEEEKKYFGIVASFCQTGAGRPGLGGVQKEWGEYTAEIVPTLWILGRKSHCRIFQKLSAPDVIKKVLDGRGLSGKYEMKLSRQYEPREYCVQYRETDLAFISRLLEEEGIYYYFTHDGKEMLVFGDSVGAYGIASPEDTVKFKSGSGGLSTAEEYLADLVLRESAYSGKVKLRDYDYDKPDADLTVEESAEKNPDLELYDYHPERFDSTGRGRFLARNSVDAQAALRRTLQGNGTWRSLQVGCVFTLTGAYRGDLNGRWLPVRVTHSAVQLADRGVQHEVSFEAIPATTCFRPMPRTPQPQLNLETATVVGPQGSAIHMDDLGRAKVQFHWDLEGKKNEDSSCWIRVAQPYAGMDPETFKKHGFQWHPLVGDEVVVDFLEGDPENPLIVGSVYNGHNTPIVKPTEHVRNRILTPYQHQLLMDDLNTAITLDTGGHEVVKLEDAERSTAFGNNIKVTTADQHTIHLAEGAEARGIRLQSRAANQMVLDDKERHIVVRTTDGHQALMDDAHRRIVVTSRDMHRVEVNDEQRFIEIQDASGQHQLRIDMAEGTVNIVTTGTINFKADKDMNITVGRNMTIDVAKKMSTTVGADASTTIGGEEEVSVGAKSRKEVTASSSLQVGGDANTSVGGSAVTKVGASARLDAAAKITLQSGSQVVVQSMKVQVKAAAQIELQGQMIRAKGMQYKVGAMMITSSAGSIHVIKGMLVKIN